MNEKELELKYIGLRDDPTECWSVNTRSGDACHSTDPCPAHLDYYKVGGVRIIVFVYLSDLKLVEHFEYCLDSWDLEYQTPIGISERNSSNIIVSFYPAADIFQTLKRGGDVQEENEEKEKEEQEEEEQFTGNIGLGGWFYIYYYSFSIE